MELGAILLLIALLIGVGLFLAAPLMGRSAASAMDESPEVSALMAERDRVIHSLQELDFDFRLGKVPEELYPQQRAGLLHKGADVLRRLDELAPSTPDAWTGAPDAGERIEEAAAGGGGASRGARSLADDKIESLLAARRAKRGAKSAGFCPRCGKPVLTSDRFCPSCGKSLQ